MEPTWIVKCVENLLRVKSFELSEAFFILIASNAAFATRFWVTRKRHSLPTIKTDFIVNHAIMSKIFIREYLDSLIIFSGRKKQNVIHPTFTAKFPSSEVLDSLEEEIQVNQDHYELFRFKICKNLKN